ncbi:calmodulin [Acrasis kona]|uniref:Calmodulin n=1 Tax=Acrasis kona TaxID=1008807 RepID=A0AAW2Z783_9EUKA
MSEVKLTEEQIAELRESYSMITNGNPAITIQVLSNVAKALGMKENIQEISDLLEEVDVDGNQEIDFAEFVTIMAKKSRDVDPEEELREAFNAFDAAVPSTEQEGFITAEKIAILFKNFGVSLSEAEVAEMIAEGDFDKDGNISFEDFSLMLQSEDTRKKLDSQGMDQNDLTNVRVPQNGNQV